jgi:hypothetical protein
MKMGLIVAECSVDVNRKMQVASKITICGDMAHATADEYEAFSQIKLLRRRTLCTKWCGRKKVVATASSSYENRKREYDGYHPCYSGTTVASKGADQRQGTRNVSFLLQTPNKVAFSVANHRPSRIY